ncbi:MAG: acetoin utilization protein [Lysobacterales bacterium]|jgi:acetoin utilization deacetylase AcuC-like enzyme|nr:MAG: acetoin utilization protein [Xanthomonadales bacterium]
MLSVWTHPACALHDPGPGHPESPKRLAAVLTALEMPEFAGRIVLRAAPLASREALALAHAPELIERVLEPVPTGFRLRLDPDTVLSEHSAEAVLRTVGALLAAIDEALAGSQRRAFCATRPPGHHATRDRPMGFCPVNGIAIAARYALSAHAIERVAVVDFDVHHGNGSEAILAGEPRALYLSSHQWPLYPGTGLEPRSDNARNAVLPPGSGSEAFRTAWRELLLPELDAFAPGLILVSAGFDAHRLDPLADLRLEADDYFWITRELCALAVRHAEGRLVSTLEGGYSLSALTECTRAHLRAMLMD